MTVPSAIRACTATHFLRAAAMRCQGVDLPELVWASDKVGTVSGRGRRGDGLAPGTPVVAGTTDAWADAFSAGVREVTVT